MHNRRKTKDELIKENSLLMQRIHELEISGAECNRTIEALKDKEQQLRDRAENIPGVIYQFYAKSEGVLGLNYVSEHVKTIFGLDNDPNDFFQRFVARIAPESINSFTESITDAVSNAKPWRYEGRFIKDSGDSLWFQGLSNPVKRAHEIIFNGVLLDITERKRAESELLLSSRRTEALLQLGQMAVASLKDITDFTLEKAVELTESKIGYLAFLNRDESTLMMHSWSKTAMQECSASEKPILYNVVDTGLWGEAVRQRKPIITNDYAAENPWKKGYPEGHVKVFRHMNVPIFDGSKIVIVAGVGNKEAEYSETDAQQLTLLMQGMWQLIKRRQAEEESEKLASIVKHSRDLVNLAAPDGSMIFLNETGRNILGLSEEDIISTNIMDVIPDNFKDIARQEILPSIERDGYWEGDLQYKNLKTGSLTDMHTVTFKITDQETGTLQYYANVSQDITERKKSEEALRERESLIRSMYEADPTGVSLTVTREIKKANRRFCEITGYQEDEILGKNTRVLYADESEYNRVGKILYDDLKANGIGKVESRWKRKDGSMIDVYLSISPLNPMDWSVGLTSVVLDISDLKRAEKDLLESMERYRLLADNSMDVVWTMDLDGRFTYVSPSIREQTGFTPEDVMAIPLDKYLFEEDVPWVTDILYSEMKKPQGERMERTLLEVRQYKKDGSLLDIEVSTKWLYDEQGEIVGLQGSTRDISARKKMERESANLEKQLLQSQKMEAIGTLAGGLAHDFNNILTTMQGHVSLMKMGLNAAHPHYSRLEKIEEQIMSSVNITRQLLGFSKGGKYEVKIINPNKILENSSEVFGRTKKELSITKRFQDDIWAIDADPGQIEQTLFNMYINAWQAMPDGGELYLESRNIFLNDMDVMPHGLKPGRYVMISITDTGIGMDKETIKRIFEPFYTTKEPGKGTGLGLASAYGIIKNHDGFIMVYSEKGKGTTFNIYMPASSNKQTGEEKSAVPGTAMGSGTILLVDDEAAIIAVTKELLETKGYKVLTAGSGQEAIAVFMEKKDSIDLVILDMIMPGIGGSKTFDDLINIDPDAKIILASGYSINSEAQRILDKGCKGFIQKPFRIAELSQKIQQVLNMDSDN